MLWQQRPFIPRTTGSHAARSRAPCMAAGGRPGPMGTSPVKAPPVPHETMPSFAAPAAPLTPATPAASVPPSAGTPSSGSGSFLRQRDRRWRSCRGTQRLLELEEVVRAAFVVNCIHHHMNWNRVCFWDSTHHSTEYVSR